MISLRPFLKREGFYLSNEKAWRLWKAKLRRETVKYPCSFNAILVNRKPEKLKMRSWLSRVLRLSQIRPGYGWHLIRLRIIFWRDRLVDEQNRTRIEEFTANQTGQQIKKNTLYTYWITCLYYASSMCVLLNWIAIRWSLFVTVHCFDNFHFLLKDEIGKKWPFIHFSLVFHSSAFTFVQHMLNQILFLMCTLYVCAFTCPYIFNFERLTKLSLLPTLHFMKNLIIVFFIDILMVVCFNASYNSIRMKRVKLLYHLDWHPNLEITEVMNC